MTPKMEPKWRENKSRQLPRGHPKTVWKYRLVFCGFGVPLDPFWHPFRRLLGILGAFRPPSGSLLASLRLSFRQPLEAFRSAENLPRFRRELAEIPPRTCRGSAENPPRTSQEPAVRTPSKVAFHIAIFSKGLRSPINASIKSPGIKVGRRSPPLGVFD